MLHPVSMITSKMEDECLMKYLIKNNAYHTREGCYFSLFTYYSETNVFIDTTMIRKVNKSLYATYIKPFPLSNSQIGLMNLPNKMK